MRWRDHLPTALLSPFWPELPSGREVVDRVAAVAGPEAITTWLRGHRETPDVVPAVRFDPLIATKFLVDEWTLRFESARGLLRPPDGEFRQRLRRELAAALELFQARGWLDEPCGYHQDPPPLHAEDLRIEPVRLPGFRFEHAQWASGFEPRDDEPGRERWLAYRRNRTAHAWLLRHDGPPRPWIVCINGYRAGDALIDLPSFRAEHLHRQLGLNVAIVVQPLHGPRKAGALSGDRVLHGGVMNLIHTTTQAAYDTRRLLSWIRAEQHAPSVGVQGLSLGGNVIAVIASLDGDLACAVAGIPEADIVRGVRRVVEHRLPAFYEQWGLSWSPLEKVVGVASPLALRPLVPPDRRFISTGKNNSSLS